MRLRSITLHLQKEVFREILILKELKLLDDGDSFRKATYKLLKESDFFSNFDEDELKILARWCKAYSADTGCVVLNEGDKSNCLCIIIKGHINRMSVSITIKLAHKFRYKRITVVVSFRNY